MTEQAISPLRRGMIEDMTIRKLGGRRPPAFAVRLGAAGIRKPSHEQTLAPLDPPSELV